MADAIMSYGYLEPRVSSRRIPLWTVERKENREGYFICGDGTRMLRRALTVLQQGA